MAAQINPLRRARQRGNEIIEFTFCLVPVLGFLFMTIDVAWMVFTRATLQNAVQQGVRYAVATRGDYPNASKDHRLRIIAEVQAKAMGLLSGVTADNTPKANLIDVEWFLPNTPSAPLEKPDKTPKDDANVNGNVVKISVTGYLSAPLLGVFHDLSKWQFQAQSADVMW